MSAVYKYQLETGHRQVVFMLRGAQILHVDVQGNDICLWARVDETLAADDTEPRTIIVAGTGYRFDESAERYIGTVLMFGAVLVWHVFEEC